MANVTFVVTWSSQLSVSPAAEGDGISLVTVADTPENESFNADSTTARTRVFFNPETGAIDEADISINPQPRSEEGASIQFSTDGTPGTYDLEATFTHEIGHLLGLDHSSVLASTMQARQAFNGMFGLAAFTERTLSEEDRQRIRNLYGPPQHLCKIQGRVTDSSGGPSPYPVTVFAESLATGRVVASDVTEIDGSYTLANLTPGKYRVFASARQPASALPLASSGGNVSAERIEKRSPDFELSPQIALNSDQVASLNYAFGSSQTSTLNPRWIGLNGELSSVALPLQPGKRFKIYLSGEGADQIPATSITLNSPYFSVDAASLSREQMATSVPVVSFELTVAPNAPFGDYSIRLQSNSGELAFIPGAITIDPGTSLTMVNPIDDFRFFVSQQYADILGHEPDQATIESVVTQLLQCGSRVDCLRAQKLDLATSVLWQNDLMQAVGLLNGLYTTALNRRPRFSEFESARDAFVKSTGDAAGARLAVALSFVQLPEFERKYPSAMSGREFVDSLLAAVVQKTGIDLSAERQLLIQSFDGTNLGRAAILNSIAGNPRLVESQYNDAFVLAEYFTLLRREPDEGGITLWVDSLKGKTVRDPAVARALVCRFLNSEEYQLRFGMIVTHNLTECN
jgi:hypothetical protein